MTSHILSHRFTAARCISTVCCCALYHQAGIHAIARNLTYMECKVKSAMTSVECKVCTFEYQQLYLILGPVLPAMSPSACQSACQTCSFDLRLVFGWSSLDLISSFCTIINLLLTSTYKPLVRTVDPKVARSSRVGILNPMLTQNF